MTLLWYNITSLSLTMAWKTLLFDGFVDVIYLVCKYPFLKERCWLLRFMTVVYFGSLLRLSSYIQYAVFLPCLVLSGYKLHFTEYSIDIYLHIIGSHGKLLIGKNIHLILRRTALFFFFVLFLIVAVYVVLGFQYKYTNMIY